MTIRRAWAGMSEEQVNGVMGEYFAFSDAIREEGIFVAGDALQGRETAQTVRVRDGSASSPTARSPRPRRSSAATTSSTATTLEQALDAAARIPSARFGAIEVRPIAQM